MQALYILIGAVSLILIIALSSWVYSINKHMKAQTKIMAKIAQEKTGSDEIDGILNEYGIK